MNHVGNTFIPLLLVLTIAFGVPILLSRLRRTGVPVVVGEILAGILIGRSGLDLVRDDATLRVLSDLGFALLMFLSGLEIDLSAILTASPSRPTTRLRRALTNPLVLGHLIFGGTLVASAAAGLALASHGLIRDPWLMALILATTSLGVVVPVLKENGLAERDYGQSLLVTSLVADFASIVLISAYVLLSGRGAPGHVLLVLVLLAAFLFAHRLSSAYRGHRRLERFLTRLSSATSQIRTRGALALALVFIGLAESLGLENILGAFLAGVILSTLSRGEGSALRQKLDAIGYGFFIPIFFVMVGVRFDLPALTSSRSALLLVPLLVGIAYAVKVVPALLLRLRHSWRDTLTGGVLLGSRLSLIIAASAIGRQMGAISEAVDAAVVLVACTTCVASPVLFNILSTKTGPRDLVLVSGSRPVASLLARNLAAHHMEVVLVSEDPATIVPEEEDDITVAHPGETPLKTLREAGIERAGTVVALDPDDEANLKLCRMAHHLFGVANVVAWVDDLSRNTEFRRVGARVVNPSYAAMLIAQGMVLSPGIFDASSDLDETQEVLEVKLRNSELVGRTVADLAPVGEIVVLTIERGGNTFAPDLGTELAANDTLTLVGPESAVAVAALRIAREGDRDPESDTDAGS